MGQMMLHPDGLKTDPPRVLAADLGQLLQSALVATIAMQMLDDRPSRLEGMTRHIAQLRRPIDRRVPRQGDMGDIAQPQPRVRQQPADGVGRKSRAVLALSPRRSSASAPTSWPSTTRQAAESA